MEFGIMTAKIDEIGLIVHAENLGFTNAWITDSPMIRSNVWAVLALAAQQTRSMKLGTAVAVPTMRLAPVCANGIATINRLAPGRCILGLGTGHTAVRTLGQKPMRLKPFAEYIRVVRGLLSGAEVDYTLDGETHKVRFQMRDFDYIDLDHEIPIHVAAYGPKAQQIAGELGDGLLTGTPRGGTLPEMWENLQAGARRGGRTLPTGFPLSLITSPCILQPGEAIDSDRVKNEVGGTVVTGLHYLVARHLESGVEPPDYAKSVWKPYLDWLFQFPEEIRHQRLHDSHNTFLDPEEAQFLSPELIQGLCFAGSGQELIERIGEWEQLGLTQIVVYPQVDRAYGVIEQFADQVISRL